MQNRVLVSLASATLLGLSLSAAGPLAPPVTKAPESAVSFAAGAGSSGWAPGDRLSRRGVVVAVRTPEERDVQQAPVDPQGTGDFPWRRPAFVVVARMADGTIHKVHFRSAPDLRLGDSVRAAGGTLIACELYRSAPFVPARAKPAIERG